jgi:enoyl-CoA hydratase/carnithine racemase
VLCSEGKHFCAGAQLSGVTAEAIQGFYRQAFRLFTAGRPVVAAVQGAAIGGGLGLALAADFRVATPESRFAANFARLGFHQGFGLSATLPTVVGRQRALELLLTGRDVLGSEALEIGLCDRLTPADPREAAFGLAAEIARSAPLSIVSIRATMRRSLIADVQAALDTEAEAQAALLPTADFREGVEAARARRPPDFTGA